MSVTPTTFVEHLRVQKLSENAKLPVRGSSLSAGYDLSSAERTIIPAKGKGVVKTDLCIACPPGTYARIAPRSGLAVKKFVDTGAGVVDADYRGNVGVVLFNFGENDFEVNVGDRIAQLILEKISMAPIVEVKNMDETERGAGGFGSTGVKEEHESTKRRMVTPTQDGTSDSSLKRKATEEDLLRSMSIADLLSFVEEMENLFLNLEEYEKWATLRPALKKMALTEHEAFKGFVVSHKLAPNKNPSYILETIEIVVQKQLS